MPESAAARTVTPSSTRSPLRFVSTATANRRPVPRVLRRRGPLLHQGAGWRRDTRPPTSWCWAAGSRSTEGVQQRAAGGLAAPAGLGADPAVLVNGGVALALV